MTTRQASVCSTSNLNSLNENERLCIFCVKITYHDHDHWKYPKQVQHVYLNSFLEDVYQKVLYIFLFLKGLSTIISSSQKTLKMCRFNILTGKLKSLDINLFKINV